MDIFNRKRIKELELEITKLKEQLEHAIDFRSTVYVSKGDAIPLVSAVNMSESGFEIPMEVVQRRLCENLVNEIINRDLVRFEVTDDPRTMSHVLHARIDVVNRG